MAPGASASDDDVGEDGPTSNALAPRKKATFLLDATLHRQLKVRAAEEGRGMIDLVEDAVRRYLAGA
jgi:hypothetical protein